MNTQDFIASEKARLQSLFAQFNRDGSWMEMREAHYEPLRFGLIDSYTITRVAPHFDAQGNITKTDFWLLFKSAGYDEGFQYSHTIKVVDWSQDDTYLIDLTDDRGRGYHIELIMDATEWEEVAAWKRWQLYKAENRDRFAEIDAQLLAEHTVMAEVWE
jgi:hypothetical protein